MGETVESNVPDCVRIGAGLFAALVLTPIVIGFLVSFMLVIVPIAALAIPIIAGGLRGDATGKPSARRMLATPLLAPVRQLKTVPVCGDADGLQPCAAA